MAIEPPSKKQLQAEIKRLRAELAGLAGESDARLELMRRLADKLEQAQTRATALEEALNGTASVLRGNDGERCWCPMELSEGHTVQCRNARAALVAPAREGDADAS